MKTKRDEPRYNRVSPKFWADDRITSDDGRLLALYMLTSPHRNMLGYYVLPREYAAADLRWKPRRLEAAWREVIDSKFAFYDEDVRLLFLPKALRYDAPANPNQIKAAVKRFSELPSSASLLVGLLFAAERYAPTLWEALTEHLRNGLHNGSVNGCVNGSGNTAAVTAAVTAAAAGTGETVAPDGAGAAAAEWEVSKPEPPPPSPEFLAAREQAVNLLRGLGVFPESATKLVNTYGPDRVREQVEWLALRPGIKSPAAAIVQAIQNGWEQPAPPKRNPLPSSESTESAEARARELGLLDKFATKEAG